MVRLGPCLPGAWGLVFPKETQPTSKGKKCCAFQDCPDSTFVSTYTIESWLMRVPSGYGLFLGTELLFREFLLISQEGK